MKTSKIGQFIAWVFALMAFSITTQAASKLVMEIAPESPRRTAFRANDGFRIVSVYRLTNTGDTSGQIATLQFAKKGLASVSLEIEGINYYGGFDYNDPNGNVILGFFDTMLTIQPGKYLTIFVRGQFVNGAKEVSAELSGWSGGFNDSVFANRSPATHALVEELGSEGIKNTSIRSTVSPSQSTILGFSVEGDKNQGYPVLVRAVGPGLANFRVANPLLDPLLKLFDKNGGLVAENDDWSGLEEFFAQVGAFPLKKGSLDSAMMLYLSPGSYTLQVKGFGSGQGEVLLEVYQLPISSGGKG